MAFWGCRSSLEGVEDRRVNGEIAKGLKKTWGEVIDMFIIKGFMGINISQNIQFYSCFKNGGVIKINTPRSNLLK